MNDKAPSLSATWESVGRFTHTVFEILRCSQQPYQAENKTANSLSVTWLQNSVGAIWSGVKKKKNIYIYIYMSFDRKRK